MQGRSTIANSAILPIGFAGLKDMDENSVIDSFGAWYSERKTANARVQRRRTSAVRCNRLLAGLH